MSKRPPGSSPFEQMLQMQNQQRMAASAQAQADYSAQLEASRQKAAADVAAQNAAANDAVQKKANQPVTLGTLLTSPQGILGNPLLSSTKLSGY